MYKNDIGHLLPVPAGCIMYRESFIPGSY